MFKTTLTCAFLKGTIKGKLGGFQKSEHLGLLDDSDKQTQHEEGAVEEKERGKCHEFPLMQLFIHHGGKIQFYITGQVPELRHLVSQFKNCQI